MGRRRSWLPLLLSLLTGFPSAGVVTGLAQGLVGPTTEQTVSLAQGWNAIFLRIDPVNPDPAKVFAGLPVSKVAAFFPSRTPVEFIQDPTSPSWKQQGWSVWYAPTLPESAISDLSAILGGQGYLVHTTAATTLTVQGTTKLRRLRWRADSFNFVGFPVDPVAPPTFAAWFAGTTAHLPTSRATLFALDAEGHWRAVDHPESTLIQPNTAYWVFSQGGSDYQGPLDVSVPLGGPGGRADFGNVAENISVRFRNSTAAPIQFTVELSPAGALPVSYELRSPDRSSKTLEPLFPAARFGPLEAGAELTVRLTLDRALMTAKEGTAFLTVRDDVGSLVRIPVSGRLP